MRTVYYVATSMDGHIADVNGGVSWLDAFTSEELGFHEFYRNVGTVIMGRTTFNQVLSFDHWPYADKRCVVLTSSPLPPMDFNIEQYQGSLEALTEQLKADTPGDIWVVGGAQVGRSFLETNLLDEIELYVVPVMLGQGITLFGTDTLHRQLTLKDATAFTNGVVKMLYQVC